MVNKSILFSVLMLLAAVTVARPINIKVSGGRNLAVPIVVLPFDMTTSTEISDIAEVIKTDLDSSGQFNALEVAPEVENFVDKGVNYSHWRQLGAEYLLTGRIETLNNGSHAVSVELIELFRSYKVKLKVRYVIQEQHFRNLAHVIADRVFASITGVRGFFATKLAYITISESNIAGQNARYRLQISDFDGYNITTLIDVKYPLMSPAWSPDAKYLAYVAFEHERASVRLLELATGEVKVISNTPGINGAPAWSPDGKKLALVLSKGGSPNIYQYNLANSKFSEVTKGRAIDTEPCYAPDGKSIFFTSNRGGKPQIYKVILSSGKIERVTFEGNYNARPSVAADGKKLVFLHKDLNNNFNIAVQGLRNGRVNLLTNSRVNESPSVAPNGAMIVFSTREGESGTLGLVSVDGRQSMRLPVSDDIVRHPAWSPYITTTG